ncbi:protein sneaky [Euwallacea similis]|uniref:protein sneaky n=1 Tax=Euwallacea similis TaxID=1736056 RepID=UPI00344BA520
MSRFSPEDLLQYLKKFALFNHLFLTTSNQYLKLKAIFGFICGLILGISFHRYVLTELSFTEEVSFWLAVTICLLLGTGLAFSTQVRCITLLAFPSFGGRVGRSVLKAMVITMVISGPIQNISHNSGEVVRVFACTATLQYNLTKARFTLMFKPFVDAIFGIKTEINEVKDTIRAIRDVSAPITGEVEGEAAMKKVQEENDYLDAVSVQSVDNETAIHAEAAVYEKQYLKKIEQRCLGQLANATSNCQKMFQNGYDKCYDTVTWIAGWLLCWPMKMNFVCNIADSLGGDGRCDPSKHIDPGLGEGYAYLQHSRISLSQNFKDVKLQYKIGKLKQIRDLRDARDTSVAIIKQVKSKQALLNAILNLVKRLLAFIFLRILINSQEYEEKYLKDLEFDNFYITRYFRKIDARRRTAGKLTLLPLKKIERTLIVDPLSPKPLKSERQYMFKETFLLILEMLTAGVFILLDSLFYEALDLIRRHAKIDYLTTGRHDLLLQVKGTGMIAALLKSLVRGFNVKKRIKMERSNEQCLPRPSKLERSYLFKIFGTYLAIYVMIWVQTYTQRTRRCICSYFFRSREKVRTLFLYNQTLKRRIGLRQRIKKNLERKARERRLEENYNIFQVMTIYSQRCLWLKFFKVARRKCLLCEETEPRKLSKYIECPNEGCHFIYCEECWVDMGEKCLVCAVEGEQEHVTEDDDIIEFSGLDI